MSAGTRLPGTPEPMHFWKGVGGVRIEGDLAKNAAQIPFVLRFCPGEENLRMNIRSIKCGPGSHYTLSPHPSARRSRLPGGSIVLSLLAAYVTRLAKLVALSLPGQASVVQARFCHASFRTVWFSSSAPLSVSKQARRPRAPNRRRALA